MVGSGFVSSCSALSSTVRGRAFVYGGMAIMSIRGRVEWCPVRYHVLCLGPNARSRAFGDCGLVTHGFAELGRVE